MTDDHTFERFLGEERLPLIKFLCGHGVLQDDAQDIAQESLHKLTRYREVPLHALKRLLYRIALNSLWDIRRREAGQRRALDTSDLTVLDSPNEVLQPEQWAEQHEELARVRAAIESLPKRCRQVYLLNRIDGMSYSQISAHQGISVKTVEKHVSKALKLLRQFLSAPVEARPDDLNPWPSRPSRHRSTAPIPSKTYCRD